MSDFELFPGKGLSDLFRDIYQNQREKNQRIYEMIDELKKIVRHAGDMAMIGPIIKDLIDTSVKNDESLIKMAAIAQRIANSLQKNEGDTGFLTEAEKELLLKDLDEVAIDLEIKNDDKINKIADEVEDIRQKIEND